MRDQDHNWQLIRRAILRLAQTYADQPGLEEVAREYDLSPFHFQRLFSRYVGVSPKHFIAHLTLDKAKAQLRQGASVMAAAYAAGLSGSSRLHDLCLKWESMTPGDYAKGAAGLRIDYDYAPSPFGPVLIMATAKGICGLSFVDEDDAKVLAEMQIRWPRATYIHAPASIAVLARQIFGPDPLPADISLHLMGSPFQIKVWQALLEIPVGQVVSYSGLADHLAQPRGARAVASAVGRNPIGYLIPCHRVLGRNGELTGYHWGLERKRALLAVEYAKAENQAAKL